MTSVTPATESVARVHAALQSYRERGDRCRDIKLWAEAARYYARHLQDHPDDFAIWVQRGNCSKEAGAYDDAREAYNRAVALNDTDHDVFLQLGHLAKIQGLRDEAVAAYLNSLRLRPRSNDALKELLALRAHAEVEGVLREAAQPEEEELPAVAPAVSLVQVHRSQTDGLEQLRRERPKILYISDSLGTPIHARGIYNYSVALLEMLASLGCDITLVVQAKNEHHERKLRKEARLSATSLNSLLLGQIYRYFSGEIFSFNFEFENPRFQKLYECVPFLARLSLRISYTLNRRRKYLVINDPESLDFFPGGGAHLRKVDKFLYVTNFYSESMRRAVTNLPPVSLRAAGFDAVICDTPHYVRLSGVSRSRVFTVVHDLIPIRDPSMGDDWKRLFVAKFRATLRASGNLIFVSEYTRRLFGREFPEHVPPRDTVIYPTIRRDQLQALTPVQTERTAFLDRLATEREKEHRSHLEKRARRFSHDTRQRATLIKEFQETYHGWNSDLPYFATVVSDEPRKNVPIYCEVSKQFIGRCNFIVIGQVNRSRYIHDEPELYPNLHFAGYVDDEAKTEVLRGATGMIFASFAEGFGIPLVEAALFGIPIICSDIEVFREVGGNSAIYFDPYRLDELAFRVGQVLQEPGAYTATAEKLKQSVLQRFSQIEMRTRLRQVMTEAGVF